MTNETPTFVHYLPIATTILAAIFCALYVANYINGWITPEDINIFGSPAD